MKKNRRNWIPVVTGILKKEQQILVGQRPENKSLPNLWEFPGGKIEHGESPEIALFRELKEELNIEATIGSLRFATTHDYEDTGLLLLFYDINYWQGNPTALHHSAIKWVDKLELQQLDLPEANKKIISKLDEFL